MNDRMFKGGTRYLEIYVDEAPVQQFFSGRLGAFPEEISPLGWRVSGYENVTFEQFQRFLLAAPADLPDGRNSILVCPLCGDLGCGAFSSRFQLDGSRMIWSEFGYENSYDPESVDFSTYKELSPLVFDWAQYQAELVRHRGD